MKKQFEYKGRDGNNIHVYNWKIENETRGIVQIFHGMAEHGGRYEEFATFLNNKGYEVYADDHRGHGKSVISIDDLGFIGKDGFNGMVEDEKILTDLIKKENPRTPIFIFAHSMGSFLAQEFITKYGNEIDGVILSGSSGKFGLDVKLAAFLAKIQLSLLGDKTPAKLLDNLSFGNYNKKITNPITKFDWLSRDENEVYKYNKDKYCGTLFPLRFYYEFFTALAKLHRKEKLKKIPKNLPIYILAGSFDPVGNYGKNVKKLKRKYEEMGIKKVKMKLYAGARHEIINELNREEVYNDIYIWLDNINT